MGSGRGGVPGGEGVRPVLEPFKRAPEIYRKTGVGSRGEAERGAEREAAGNIRGSKREARDSVRLEGDKKVRDGT